MNTTPSFVTICPRCNGTGRFDRGVCFECRRFGGCGWVRRTRPSKSVAHVTAVRDQKEGRIAWISIHGATASQAIDIVQRQMRVAEKPQWLIDSVQATV